MHTPAESRHARDIFSNCNNERVGIVKHLISQHHVDQCVNVHAHVEVLMVAASEPCTNTSEGTIAMRM